ncbi:hypothetical protein [Corynebacterium sp. 335C]
MVPMHDDPRNGGSAPDARGGSAPRGGVDGPLAAGVGPADSDAAGGAGSGPAAAGAAGSGGAAPAAGRRPLVGFAAIAAVVGLVLVGVVALVGGRGDAETDHVAGVTSSGGGAGGGASFGGSGDATDDAPAAGADGSGEAGDVMGGGEPSRPKPGAGDGSAAPSAEPTAARALGTMAAPTGSADADGAAARPADAPRMILSGEVIQFRGEQVLVCATGDGRGVSHVGVTAEAGATGARTAADEPALCDIATDVTGALMERAGDGPVDLSSPAEVDAAGRHATCEPLDPGIMRCTVDGGALVTIWSEADRRA